MTMHRKACCCGCIPCSCETKPDITVSLSSWTSCCIVDESWDKKFTAISDLVMEWNSGASRWECFFFAGFGETNTLEWDEYTKSSNCATLKQPNSNSDLGIACLRCLENSGKYELSVGNASTFFGDTDENLTIKFFHATFNLDPCGGEIVLDNLITGADCNTSYINITCLGGSDSWVGAYGGTATLTPDAC